MQKFAASGAGQVIGVDVISVPKILGALSSYNIIHHVLLLFATLSFRPSQDCGLRVGAIQRLLFPHIPRDFCKRPVEMSGSNVDAVATLGMRLFVIYSYPSYCKVIDSMVPFRLSTKVTSEV